jgi:four helix bundle suffix protein
MAWMNTRQTRTNTDQKKTDEVSLSVGESPCPSVPESVLVANAALSLLNLCCYLLDRQLATQAEDFEKEGGFSERMYRVRHQSWRTTGK